MPVMPERRGSTIFEAGKLAQAGYGRREEAEARQGEPAGWGRAHGLAWGWGRQAEEETGARGQSWPGHCAALEGQLRRQRPVGRWQTGL